MKYKISKKIVLVFLTVFSLVSMIESQSSTNANVEEICYNSWGSCETCMNAHPDCTWCFESSKSNYTFQYRCRTKSINIQECERTDLIIDTKSTVKYEQDRDFQNVENINSVESVDQIRPQNLGVKLRVGDSITVNITARKLFDYPLDLYYLMDLSLSMLDDLTEIKAAAGALVEHLNNLSSNAHVGFGSFVDKEVGPFTVPENLIQKICEKRSAEENIEFTCQTTFDYHHQLSITPNSTLFVDVVNKTLISANVDEPEGAFDALMQVVVCQDIIKWRKNSQKVVLIATDATPHMAWDGKLAGIIEPNDMKCHLIEDGDSGILLNAVSRQMDYPSVGQLQEVLDRHNIQAIFAVSGPAFDLYKNLPISMKNSIVAPLSKDSSNIQSLIRQSYEEIRNNFQLSRPTNVPSNVDLSYRVKCPGTETWVENSLQCNPVLVNDDVEYQFTFTAKVCPSIHDHLDNISISSPNIPDVVTITIGYECECMCKEEDNSSECNFHGKLACGVCECDSERSGKFCQCDFDPNLIDPCRPLNATEDEEICSGNGDCECGECLCRENYFDEFCQCSDLGCPHSDDDLLCGGTEKGTCKNCDNDQFCDCNTDAGWQHDQQGTCTCNENRFCKLDDSDDTLCSGRGVCDCTKCNCDDNGYYWAGRNCNNCVHPNCTGINPTCDVFFDCAKCVYDYHNNELECRSKCRDQSILSLLSTEQVSLNCDECENEPSTTEACTECSDYSLDKLPLVECIMSDQCLIYQIGWHKSLNQYFVRVLQKKDSDGCTQEFNPVIVFYIIGPIIFGGTVLLGLAIWIKRLHDAKMYKKFTKESSINRRWTQNDNPCYKDAVTKTINPMYISNDDDYIKDSGEFAFDERLYTNLK